MGNKTKQAFIITLMLMGTFVIAVLCGGETVKKISVILSLICMICYAKCLQEDFMNRDIYNNGRGYVTKEDFVFEKETQSESGNICLKMKYTNISSGLIFVEYYDLIESLICAVSKNLNIELFEVEKTINKEVFSNIEECIIFIKKELIRKKSIIIHLKKPEHAVTIYIDGKCINIVANHNESHIVEEIFTEFISEKYCEHVQFTERIQ